MKHPISITLLLLYSTNAFSGSVFDLDEHGPVMRFGGQDFAYYENTTVKNWKALSSSNSKVRYRGEGVNNFIKSCLEKCASGDKRGPDGQCGGVALIYRDKNRTMPTMCLFASRESEVVPVGGSSRQTYDLFQQLCYPGGPYTEQCQKNNVQACWSGSGVGEDNKRTWLKVVDKDMPGMYFKKYNDRRDYSISINSLSFRKIANEHDYDFVNRCLRACTSGDIDSAIEGKCKSVIVHKRNSKPYQCRFTKDTPAIEGARTDSNNDIFVRDEALANQQKCLRGLATHGWEGGFRVDDVKQKQQMERTAVALCVARKEDGNKSRASQCQEGSRDWGEWKELLYGSRLAYWCAYDWPNMAPAKRDDVNSLLSTNGSVDLCQGLYASAKLFESCADTVLEAIFADKHYDHEGYRSLSERLAGYYYTSGAESGLDWTTMFARVYFYSALALDRSMRNKFLNSSFLHKGASLELEEEWKNVVGGIEAQARRIRDTLNERDGRELIDSPLGWYHAWEFIPDLRSALEHPQYGLRETLAWSHCGIDQWKLRGYLGNWRY